MNQTGSSEHSGMTKHSNRINWSQIFVGVVVGALLGIGGTFFGLQGRISKLEGIVEQFRADTQQPKPSAIPRSTNAKPEELISIVQEQQRKNVRESYGELAHQCFTEDDLTRFVQTTTTERITGSLKRDPRFLDVVLAIRDMEPGERSTLLISADKPLRPTWAELERISREGQTEAGQEAEKMIATAIVTLVKELVKMPEAEFLGLYDN